MHGDGSAAGRKEEEEEGLKRGTAEWFDEFSESWERLWGDHIHQGYYEPGVSATASDNRRAVVRMVEEALAFAQVSGDPAKRPKNVVDVGCGIGGGSRFLAKKYGANCQGITLSPHEAQRATALAIAEGLADKVSFQVADALAQPFGDGQFDLVWSMECGEYVRDRAKLLSEMARVAAPGATIVMTTWCHRDLSPGEESLRPDEKKLLNKICNAYHLPDPTTVSDYINIAETLNLQDIRTADWSENVAPFWSAVVRSAMSWQGITFMLFSGWKAIRRALAVPLRVEGYKKKTIKYVVITCRKPQY